MNNMPIKKKLIPSDYQIAIFNISKRTIIYPTLFIKN